MKWYSESKQEKRNRLEVWHKWFVWWPTRIGSHIHFLTYIGRIGEYQAGYENDWWRWKYCELHELEFNILKGEKNDRIGKTENFTTW